MSSCICSVTPSVQLGNATITSLLCNVIETHYGSKEALREQRSTTGAKPRTSHHRPPGGERRGKTIFPERTRQGNQTNIGTVPKATLAETSERRGGAHVGFSGRIDIILS